MAHDVLVSHAPNVVTFTVTVMGVSTEDVGDIQEFIENALASYGNDEGVDESDTYEVKAEAAVSGGPFRRMFVNRLARRAGVSEAVAAKLLADAEEETGRPFLDWLLNGGLEKLLELILKLLPIFLAGESVSDVA